MLAVLTIVLLIFLQNDAVNGDCDLQQPQSIVEKINILRGDVAKGDFATFQREFPGSDKMYKLKTDDFLQKLAENDAKLCSPLLSFIEERYALNYYMAPNNKGIDPNDFVDAAVSNWRFPSERYEMDDNITYSDLRLESFANMIYYKSLKAGCVLKKCEDNKKCAVVCVFSERPKLNSPLYIANKERKGCVADPKSCYPGSKCQMTEGLCKADDVDDFKFPEEPTTTSRTTTATDKPTTVSTPSSPTTQATTTASQDVMTDQTRTMVVALHNNRRTLLAYGTVINGNTGRKCGQAKNLYRMSYDQLLEIDAQSYANQCPQNELGSPIYTRPQSGENVKIIQSNTISIYDAVTSAVRFWWEEIAANGINKEMLFTDFLQTKPMAPIRFTQMAWAATYRVGCGAQRCGSTTVVVCRYAPRGNIVGQYIYNVGKTCADCTSTCVPGEGLCAAPIRQKP